MTDTELKAFMQGVIVSNEGKIIISDTTPNKRIANIDYNDDGSAIVTYTDGSIIKITKVDKDEDGKITRVYMEDIDGNKKYIDCNYSDDYLKTIGDVYVDDIESLGITTTPNLQDKSVMPQAQEQSITYDSDYDGLGTVTILGDANLIPENIKKGVIIFNVEGTAEGGGGTPLKAIAFTDENYSETVTLEDDTNKYLTPTFNENGNITNISVDGENVDVEYDENGILSKVGNIDVSGINLLSMFAEGGGGINDMIPNYSDLIDTIEGFSYEAIKDCYVEITTVSTGAFDEVYSINGNYITQGGVQGAYRLNKGLFLKKGDILTLREHSTHTVTINVYGLTSGSSSNTHNYSTEEQVVGTWINKKPLYEKTFEFNGNYTGDVSLNISVDNPDYIWIENGNGINSGGVYITIPYVHPTTTFLAGCFLNANKSQILLRTGTGITITKAYFTIRYTKTTD